MADGGPTLFVRYAFPPNSHGYCGPGDSAGFLGYGLAGVVDPGFRQMAQAFAGAWPYLELIAGTRRGRRACEGAHKPSPTISSTPEARHRREPPRRSSVRARTGCGVRIHCARLAGTTRRLPVILAAVRGTDYLAGQPEHISGSHGHRVRST